MSYRLLMFLGNTHIRFGVFSSPSENSLIPDSIVHLPQKNEGRDGSPLPIESLLQNYRETVYPVLKNYLPTQVVMVSVTPSRNLPLAKEISDTFKCPVKILTHDDLPPIAYSPPNGMGLDRLVKIHGICKLYPEEKVTILDFGTALTIDVVDGMNQNKTKNSSKDNYLGGMILPGFSLSLSALHTQTENLPHLTPSSSKFLSRSTEDCITGGTFHFYTHAINGIIEKIRVEYFNEEKFRLILTGGDAIWFKNTLKFKSELVENFNLIVTHQLIEKGVIHV